MHTDAKYPFTPYYMHIQTSYSNNVIYTLCISSRQYYYWQYCMSLFNIIKHEIHIPIYMYTIHNRVCVNNLMPQLFVVALMSAVSGKAIFSLV